MYVSASIFEHYPENYKDWNHLPFFDRKIIHRMIFIAGGANCEILGLIPEKLIKHGKIVNGFYDMSRELINDYSKEICKPEDKSIFTMNLVERTLKKFEGDYVSIFYKNSENLKFVEKFINLEITKKEIISKQLDQVFLKGYKTIIILNEISDYKKFKMYREVGINSLRAKLKELLKQ